MKEMTILEYLAFENDVQPNLRSVLKEIYYVLPGGKKATIENVEDGLIKCVVDPLDAEEEKNNYDALKVALSHEVATILLSRSGRIISRDIQNVPVGGYEEKTEINKLKEELELERQGKIKMSPSYKSAITKKLAELLKNEVNKNRGLKK